MPRTARRTPMLITAAAALTLAAGGCSRSSPEGQGNANPGAVPENNGMGQAGTGVGDNAPGGSDGAATGANLARPRSTPGGAADYPATGRP